jgi:hypothetical protein
MTAKAPLNLDKLYVRSSTWTVTGTTKSAHICRHAQPQHMILSCLPPTPVMLVLFCFVCFELNARTRSDSTKGKGQGDTFVEKKEETLPRHFIASGEYTTNTTRLFTNPRYLHAASDTNKGLDPQVHHITTGEQQIKPTKE